MAWEPARHSSISAVGTRHLPHGERPNAAERGYDWGWQKLRAAYAANYPAICDAVLEDGTICNAALASRLMHLEHRIPKDQGGTDDESNLHWHCWSCHNRKTQRERRFRAEVTMGISLSGRWVVCGPPGSGKSTYVRERKQLGDVVWDMDVVMASLAGVVSHEWDRALLPLATAMRETLIGWIAPKNVPVRAWIIATYESTAIAIAKRICAELVVLDVPVAECKRRLAIDGRLKPEHDGVFETWRAPFSSKLG